MMQPEGSVWRIDICYPVRLETLEAVPQLNVSMNTA